MRFCFILGAIALTTLGLEAAPPDPPATRVTTAVRADSQSGRLIRTSVVASRVVAPKVIAPISPAPPPVSPVSKVRAEPSATVNKLVDSIARQHDLEPSLVDSVIRVESNYNTNAVSPAGAMGLMQLIPSTARRFGVNDTFHPQQNIEGGVRYLKYLMELYHGNERLALAAYNAGEGAVAKYKGIPPYPETQNYVYQVGKRLGQSREAERRAKSSASEVKPAVHVPVIEKTVDADGREFYRTH
jgi:soluble lytic murein transglycosylase-like protein